MGKRMGKRMHLTKMKMAQGRNLEPVVFHVLAISLRSAGYYLQAPSRNGRVLSMGSTGSSPIQRPRVLGRSKCSNG